MPSRDKLYLAAFGFYLRDQRGLLPVSPFAPSLDPGDNLNFGHATLLLELQKVSVSGYAKHRQFAATTLHVQRRTFTFCRGYDELRVFLRFRTSPRQPVSASRRRLLHLRRALSRNPR